MGQSSEEDSGVDGPFGGITVHRDLESYLARDVAVFGVIEVGFQATLTYTPRAHAVAALSG